MKIVLGTDGSAHSRLAEELILKMPRWREAEVVIACVTANVMPFSAGFGPAAGMVYTEEVNDLHDELEKQSESAAHAAERRLKAAGLNARAVVLEGSVASELLDLADRESADLIAVGSRGENALVGFLLGSTARRLVSYSKSNVLIARSFKNEQPEESLRRLSGCDKLNVQVCIDGSKGSEMALDRACEQGTGAYRKAVAACAEPLSPLPLGIDPGSFGDTYKSDHEEAEKLVAGAKDRLQSCSDEVVTVTRLGIPDHVLMDIAEEQGVDLIAIGATRHGFVERFLLGSVSYDVATHAPCSVLVVRQPG